MHRLSGYLASASIALGLLCTPASAKLITFQVPGSTGTVPLAISNKGEVTGWFSDQAGQHGFVRAADGTITTIDLPDATLTYPTAINGEGAIVGLAVIQTSTRKHRVAFLRTPDGQITEFQAPQGKSETVATSIDNAGWIAGWAKHSGGTGSLFGFLRDPSGHFTVFGEDLTVSCANSANTTAGSVSDGSVLHGFVRTADGTITQFDPDGATYTIVNAINNAGTTTGIHAKTPGNIYDAFIRAADGTISSFAADARARSTTPRGINDAGVIAGYYENKAHQGIYHGFVRTPDGTITTVDVHGASSTWLYGINRKDQATGAAQVNGEYVGFIWKP